MYVCLCNGITDGQIREAIYEGCCSYREVRESLGVGTQCGKCACDAKQIVRETIANMHTAHIGQVGVQHFNPQAAYAVA